MTKYYLAIDIGASSGRHVLGSLNDGRIQMEEVYRFENGLIKKNGHLCWDIDQLLIEIKNGLKECMRIGKIPISLGIDTWGVDFVLLDKRNQILGDTIAYRDNRTKDMDKKVAEVISQEELYQRTGIQKQIFNTIYQLLAVKQHTPEHMDQAACFLMIPDYLNYLLTGNKMSEYTNATTTQLVNAKSKNWDFELMNLLGIKKEIFLPLSMPKTTVGLFTEEIEREIGFSCKVVLPATHDTGSAVLAVPAREEDFIYISSGTWSLMGIECTAPNCTNTSRGHNFTNEGGYDYRYRYLKNIMGLWMIQKVREETGKKYSYAELCRMAEEASTFPSRVDVNDDSFLSPESMSEAVKSYCLKTGQVEPETIGEMAACIYQSLAESYAKTIREIESITGKTYLAINIVGGGSKADYLNKLTAKATGKMVYAGPTEATAIGNLVALMLKEGEFESLEEARECVYKSFDIEQVRE